jgi:uncharacterized protein (DUF983 family)
VTDAATVTGDILYVDSGRHFSRWQWGTAMRFWQRITTALQLRCPRCRNGRLFVGLLRMNTACPQCELKLEPEPGFYLGSAYANYAATTLIETAAFVVAVFGFGCNKDVVLWGCVGFAVLFPLWFFRYARSIWLSLMYVVSSSDWVNLIESEDTRSPRKE